MSKYLFPTGEQNPRYAGGDVTLTCQMCGDTFVRNRMKKKAKFCSISCSVKNIHRPEIIAKRAKTATGLKRPYANYKKGEESPFWLGEDVGYAGLHTWLTKTYGSPERCEDCGVKGVKRNGCWSIHWSNNSREYKRDRKDFSGRCVSCHKKYDLSLIRQVYA
jgi:hypothetical protein